MQHIRKEGAVQALCVHCCTRSLHALAHALAKASKCQPYPAAACACCAACS